MNNMTNAESRNIELANTAFSKMTCDEIQKALNEGAQLIDVRSPKKLQNMPYLKESS